MLFGLLVCLSGSLQCVKGFPANMFLHVMSSFSQFAKKKNKTPGMERHRVKIHPVSYIDVCRRLENSPSYQVIFSFYLDLNLY